ncbi:MAG: hypothetical protein QF890_10145 [Myxococcota bacterium]|jgi:hypothetical protein|nr:hypothetical protein [Myxococcota bacterium]MDP7298512.1 hypothetical protein [Myxococcota bacterium]MDP7432919.1 hypothetical protein [Myxococcota bacterium]HJO25079.1 hypothetical protein [Myxococcota bacterium]
MTAEASRGSTALRRDLAPDVVLFSHAQNDPTNNMTLQRMRRPLGKAAFALTEDAALELRGYPVDFSSIRFPHDSHYNARGHEILTGYPEPILPERIAVAVAG